MERLILGLVSVPTGVYCRPMESTKPFESWMRAALFVTTALNFFGALNFLPPFPMLREQAKFPDAHPLYLWILSIWIFAFGACYLWMALARRADKIFIAAAATGKISFFLLLAWFALAGELPMSTALSAIFDLVLGIIFIAWLWVRRDT